MLGRNDNPALNADEVAAFLGLNRKTVYKLASKGAIGSFRIGRKLLFSQADVDKYLLSAKSSSANALRHGTSTSSSSCSEIAIADDTIVLAGDELAADIIANYIQSDGLTMTRVHESSYCGLVNLYKERTDATLLHLYDQRTKGYNVPYVQRMAPGVPIVVMRLIERPVGFIVRSNKQNSESASARTWSDLVCKDVKIATRKKGYAMRILLDEKLLGIEANLVRMEERYIECASELEIAESVVSGRADVGVVSIDSQNLVKGLRFIPLQKERLDLAIKKSNRTRPFLHNLVGLSKSPSFLEHIAMTTKGTCAELGAIVYEC